MKKISFLFLIHLITWTVLSQMNEKDSLISATIFNDTLHATDPLKEQWISKKLKGLTLANLVDKKIINRNDMRDFALPLGVFKNNKPINFTQGMLDMWKMKAAITKRNSPNSDSRIMPVALMGVEAMLEKRGTTTLVSYRDSLIKPVIELLKNLHKDIKPLYSTARADFMEIIASTISADMMVGFNIQELLPPTHMLANGAIKPVNPIFKTYYFDRLLREAGTEFIQYYPARYDQVHSYGPFQLTGMAVADIQANIRLTNAFKKFKTMDDLITIEDHILVTGIFAYNNWERLSFLLNQDGTLLKFNEWFKDYSSNVQKERKLRIFISGITACMHHDPPETWKMFREYLKSIDNFDKIHYECIAQYGNKQLRKYYTSSVEAYLIMPVYIELFRD
jgi:hypothetical protein